MVFKVDVEGGLRQLSALRKRMGELIEWDKLAEQEQRPHQAPAFEIHTSLRRGLREDLRSFYGFSLSLAIDIGEVLSRYDFVCTLGDRERWRRRLARLEDELANLRVWEKFIKP